MADVFEGAVALVEEQQFRLAIAGPLRDLVHLRIDMPVDQEDVLPAVVRKIDKGIAPSDVPTGGACDARNSRGLGKIHVPVVAIESAVFVIEVRNEKRHASGVQIIAERDAHVGLGRSVGVERHARSKADVGEFATAIALIQVIGLAVVGDEKIELAVVVEVAPNCGQAKAMLGIAHARSLRGVGERPIVVVVVQVVGRAFEAARPALDVDAHVPADIA